MANNNRKIGAHGVTIAASATPDRQFIPAEIDAPKPDVQVQLAQTIADEAQGDEGLTVGEPLPNDPTRDLNEAHDVVIDGPVETPAPTPDADNTRALLALVSNLANKVTALEVELQATKAKPEPTATGAALVPAQSTFAALRRRGGPASAREVASFTSKRHIGLVPQVAPNHYVDLADIPANNVANMVIKLLVAHNPKRQFSQHRFNMYRNGMLVSQYIEACVKARLHGGNSTTCLRDLAYDSNRQYIAVLPPGSKVDTSMPVAPHVASEARPFAPTPVGASAEVAKALAVLRASLGA
jgi:hypothetical protein